MGSSRPSMDSNGAVFWMIWTCQRTYWSFLVLDLMVLPTLQNISSTLDEKCLRKTTLGQVSLPALSDSASLPFQCSFSVSFRWVCSCFHLYLLLLVSKKWPVIVSKTGRCLRFYWFYWPRVDNMLNFLLCTPQQKGELLKNENNKRLWDSGDVDTVTLRKKTTK